MWRSWDFKEQAASALKLTANDMLKNKLIDGIIKEPLGGAHHKPEEAYKLVKKELKKHIKSLKTKDADERVMERIEKFSSMGVIIDPEA